MSLFKKAERKKSFLRLAITGPTGSGKTYSALRIAKGIAAASCEEKIAFIDTEHGSAALYSDRFDFDVAEMQEPYAVEKYARAMQESAKAGYKILIIDSLTHAWHQILEEVNKIAKTKYSGNTFRAWSEGSPLYNALINSILKYPGHVICGMRSKMEYSLEKNESTGKNTVVKHGLAVEQRNGIEYEFTMQLEGTTDHIFTVTKDRSGMFQDQIIEKPTEQLGADLFKWLNGEKVKNKDFK